MFDIPALIVVPLAVFVICLTIVARTAGRRSALGLIALFLATVAAGWWDIAQSRSSTAGIGFLFLPAMATVVGLLGAAGVGLRRSRSRVIRLIGTTVSVAAALLIALEIADGVNTIHRNRARDRAAATRRA